MTEYRKTGDTLVLSGTLNEATPILDADWVGATAKVNIADASTLDVVVDHGDVDLTVVGSVKTYRYEGDPLDAGSYLYEIEVTYADGTIRTFPNDRTKMRLKVVAELA